MKTWTRRQWISVIGGAILMAGLIFLAAYILPIWIVDSAVRRSDFGGPAVSRLDAKARADAEANERRTLLAALGAILAGGLALWRTFSLDRQVRIQKQEEENSRRDELNSRFAKAVAFIGASELEIRLGGLYALDAIGREARETYRWTVAKILCAYIRTNSHKISFRERPTTHTQGGTANESTSSSTVEKNKPYETMADVQAALRLVASDYYAKGSKPLDLRGAVLNGYDLQNGCLNYANLENIKLNKAKLNGTKFYSARLNYAQMNKAELDLAYFHKAELNDVRMSRSSVKSANFQEASLLRSIMNQTDFQESDFTKADLTDAVLKQSIFYRAKMQHATLYRAELNAAILNHAILDNAKMNATILQNARLVSTSLQNAEMKLARLKGADLEWAILKDTDLKDAFHMVPDEEAARMLVSARSTKGAIGVPAEVHVLVRRMKRANREKFSPLRRPPTDL